MGLKNIKKTIETVIKNSNKRDIPYEWYNQSIVKYKLKSESSLSTLVASRK